MLYVCVLCVLCTCICGIYLHRGQRKILGVFCYCPLYFLTMGPCLNLCYIGSQQATVIFQTLLPTVLDLQVSMNTLISLEIYILYLSFFLSLSKKRKQSTNKKQQKYKKCGCWEFELRSIFFQSKCSYPLTHFPICYFYLLTECFLEVIFYYTLMLWNIRFTM